MHLRILLCLISALCIAQSSTQAHIHVEVADPLVVSAITPFAIPFTRVPKYIFENPPYVQRNWTDESFAARRKAAESVSKEQIRKLVLPSCKDSNSPTFKKKYLEAAEAYDWIHAMNLIDKNLHKGGLNIQFVKELNRCLGRLTIENTGAIRVRPIRWDKCNFDKTEIIFWAYLERTPNQMEFFRKIGYWQTHTRKFCESVEGLLNNEDRYLRVEGGYISTGSIKDLLTALSNPRVAAIDELTGQPIKIETGTAESWEAQERDTNPNYRPGFIDLSYWYTKRIHEFCPPEEILPCLSQALESLATSPLHPLEKAARIWLDIVRIHPFNGAHKRTGRALASRILLEHGYLPPVLTCDDIKDYEDALMNSLDPEKGYELFTQFVIRMVKRTQDHYAGQTL